MADPDFDPRWQALAETIPDVGESPEVRLEFLERERIRVSQLDELFDTSGWAMLQRELSGKLNELYDQLRRADAPHEMYRLQGKISALEVVLSSPDRAREAMQVIDEELRDFTKEET